MSKNKYIKLVIFPDDDIVFYRVIETRNIDFVEPGYLENVEVHLIENNEARGTKDQPIFVSTPDGTPFEVINGNE